MGFTKIQLPTEEKRSYYEAAAEEERQGGDDHQENAKAVHLCKLTNLYLTNPLIHLCKLTNPPLKSHQSISAISPMQNL